jgi:hypothetical protein
MVWTFDVVYIFSYLNGWPSPINFAVYLTVKILFLNAI